MKIFLLRLFSETSFEFKIKFNLDYKWLHTTNTTVIVILCSQESETILKVT